MKCVVFLAAVIACSLAAEIGNFGNETDTFAVTEDDVTYFLYNRHNQQGREIHFKDFTSIESLGTAFDSSVATVILIHGWKDDNNANFNTEIRSALLDTTNVNVIKVDWSTWANQNYLAAKLSVPSVGKQIAQFLIRLNHFYRYSYNQVTIIGFSLGAHIAGCTGSALGGTVAQIVGLDPAGPLISHTDTDYCLDPTDGQYVTAIHTNAGKLGIVEPVGHSDYFVNGGAYQTGCIEIAGTCSHNRAWAYMAESIRSNKFVSNQCTDDAEYSDNNCKGSQALMGGFPVDKSAFGSFFLSTNRRAPFGRG